MTRPLLAAAIAALPLLGASAAAQTVSTVAADVSGGTTGLSANVQVALTDRLAVRMGYNWLDYAADDVESAGVIYDGDLEFSGFGGFLDLHPFKNPFTITGGVFVGDKAVALEATPTEDVDIGGVTFTPEELGVVDGAADFDDAALFAGLGWDSSLYGRDDWSFIVRAGVMFAGEPEVTLDATGLANEDIDPFDEEELREALDREADELEDDIDDYAFWPVLTVGVGYTF